MLYIMIASALRSPRRISVAVLCSVSSVAHFIFRSRVLVSILIYRFSSRQVGACPQHIDNWADQAQSFLEQRASEDLLQG